MASGGNDTSKVAKRVKWEDTGIPIYDIYIKDLKENTWSCPPLGRYPMTGEIENDNSPW
jgi:hypothetical protein